MNEDTEIIDRIFDQDRLVGLSTGFPSLDELVKGLRKGSLIILAGATGMGKSLLAINILVNLAKAGVSVDYYDLENGEEQSIQRLMQIWYEKPKSFFVEDNNKSEAYEMYKTVDDAVTYWDHEKLLTYAKATHRSFMGALRTLLDITEARVVVIDPLQALETSSTKRDLLEQQGRVVRILKELAQAKDKTIILCHHIRKSQASSGSWVSDIDEMSEIKYRLPTLEDLRGSGKISDFATDVWSMVRTAASTTAVGRGKTLIRILKQRAGLQGDVKNLFLDEDTLTFKDKKLSRPVDIYEDLDGGSI